MNEPLAGRARRSIGHLLAIAPLYALVAVLVRHDFNTPRNSGGGWIALDLRSMFIPVYLAGAGLGVVVLLVHLSVTRVRKSFGFGLVLACIFPPAIAVPVGCALAAAYGRSLDQRHERVVSSTANALADAIHLRWALLDAQEPARFEIELTSSLPVEVAHVSVSGSAELHRGWYVSSSASSDLQPSAFRLDPGIPRRVELTLDHTPVRDTYWSIYCRLTANGTTVGVSWIDPSQPVAGGDAVRRIALRR